MRRRANDDGGSMTPPQKLIVFPGHLYKTCDEWEATFAEFNAQGVAVGAGPRRH